MEFWKDKLAFTFVANLQLTVQMNKCFLFFTLIVINELEIPRIKELVGY